ncbi:MAG TPA: hypothetical protein VG735_06690 [Caulobacterales bacterium]|nr:hypothetical protein [Caulobacterales bacterium]
METPKLGDFFKKGLAAHVVREISQNTMDNRVGDAPAQLRFQFASPANPLAFLPYLEGLKEHVEACAIDGADVDWSQPRLLLIEDFGTRGLEGPIHDKNAAESFAKFWYRTGDSNKKQGSSKGGRHGVGKVVNAEASRVRAFFGYGVAAADGQRTLLGRSYLKPHSLAHDTRDFHGLGTFDDGAEGEDFKPLADAEADAFASVVGFARKPHVPGLSLAALWPKEDVDPASIRAAVLSECLYQLTSGQLTVAINGDTIDSANVVAEISKADNATALLKMHGLIKAACEATDHAYRRPKAVIDPSNTSTRLSKESFDEDALEAMRAEWLAGEPIFIEAQILLRPKGKVAVPSKFRMAITRAESSESGVVCVRDDVTVRGAVQWGKRSAVALMVAEDNELSGFLGDAEGPSHEDWDPEYVKERYSYAAQTIRTVKASLHGVYDLLTSGDAEKPIENALIDFFSWTPPEEAKKKKKAPPKKKQAVPPPEIERRPPLVTVKKQKDGFIVSATEDAGEAGAFDLSIRCAYLVRFGDAFKEYSEYDFELEKGHVDAEGAGNFAIKGNTIVAKGAGAKLHVRVHGLDPNRDLDVRVRVTASSEVESIDAEAA